MKNVSTLLKGLVLCSAVAVTTLPATGQQEDIRTPIISAIAEITIDLNNDGTPDLEGQSVNVTGRVTLPTGSSPYGDDSAFLQDYSGGVLLDRVGEHIVEGDSIRVSGTIELRNGRTALSVATLTNSGASRSLPVAHWISESELDVLQFANQRVEVSGTIVHMDRFDERSTVVVNRPGIPIYVHVPHLGEGADFLKADIGDFVRVKGVLSERRTSSFPPVQLLVTDFGAFTPSIPVESYVNWGLVAACLVFLVGLYFLASKVHNRVRVKKETPFKAMVDQAGSAMVVADGSMKITYANKAATVMLRQSPANIRSQSLEKLLSLSDKGESFSDIVGDLRRGHHKSVTAFLAEDRNNDHKMLDVNLSTVKIDGRKAVLAVMNDVTSHADDVEKYKLFHEELLDGMPVEVAILSMQGKYLYMNSAGLVDNLTKSWLIGKTDVELCKKCGLSPDIGLRRRAHWRRAVTSGEAVRFEEVITTGGIEQHILRTFQPIRDAAGEEVAAVVGFGMDITELKQSRALLDKATGEVNEVTQLKESFLENINHEFRTPITGIIGFAEILEDEVGEEQREFVNMIERNGRRLMNTLNAVLDLAGLNNNEFDLAPTVFNLVDEARLVIEGSKEMAEEKGLFLKLEAARPEIITLADQICFARVLQNLIDNSIKFTEAGGIIVEIDGGDRGVHIRVLDTGVGIDNEYVPMVFDDFNRASGSLTGSFEGVGIGLGITRRLVELMNGTISVESQKAEGSIFSITLPRAFPARSKHGPGKPRILLVDESSDVNTMIQYMLADFFTLDRAVNLRELETMSKRNRYDTMMVDMSLMKHEAVIQGVMEARDRYDDIKTPIIGIADGNRRGEGIETPEGFDYVLSKPFKKSDLLTFMSIMLMDRDAFSDADDSDHRRTYSKTG